MASVVDIVGLALIVGVNTAVTAILTRLFRVRLASRWGPPLYVALVGPVVLVGVTLLLSGPFGLGPDLGGPGPVIFLTVVAPLGVGLAIDYLWMPAPEDVDVPRSAR